MGRATAPHAVSFRSRRKTRRLRLRIMMTESSTFLTLCRAGSCGRRVSQEKCVDSGRLGVQICPCRPICRNSNACAFSKHYPPENYVIGALSDSLKPMAGWVLRWLSAVRTRRRQRLELLLEFIALRHQLAVLQRTGTRRPCFRPSERLFWLFLSCWWVNWQRSLIIVQPATVLRWRRRGLWAIWRFGSCRRWRGGRPRINSEVRALIVRMSQENFLWGAPRIHGELLKLGFDVSQATVSRYMPRRGYPRTQTWRTFLRNQAFGIGTIGLGEAGRLSDNVLALVRGWIARVVRCVTKARDSFRCELIDPSLTLHRLRPYPSSNHTTRRDPRSRCMPAPRSPTALGRGDNWTVAARRLSPYRSRASPTRKLPASRILHDQPLSRAQAAAIPAKRLYCTSATNNPLKKLMIVNVPPLPGALLRDSPRGQSFEESQPVPTGILLDPGRLTTLDFDFEERTGRMCRPIRRSGRWGGSEFRQELSAKVARVTKDAATLGGPKFQITSLKLVARVNRVQAEALRSTRRAAAPRCDHRIELVGARRANQWRFIAPKSRKSSNTRVG
jgi:hypothetical protein